MLHSDPSSLKDESAGDDAIADIDMNIFLLCRNPVSAQQAIRSLTDSSNMHPKRVHLNLIHVPFDASNRTSVKAAIASLSQSISDGKIINGLLLNAGGFTSDRTGTITSSGTTIIAETNLIGHAVLVDGLIQSKKLQHGSRVIFSGSEAGMGEPFAIKWGDKLDDYVNILNGKAYRTKNNTSKYSPQDAYGHIKGMMAFYVYALAKQHPDIYFATVSPGSSKDTDLIDQGSFSGAFKLFVKGFIRFIRLSGQHSVEVGAARYIDALMANGSGGYSYKSGTFVSSKKGYIGEVCDATELKKGKAFGDKAKQDLVFEAVQMFIISR